MNFNRQNELRKLFSEGIEFQKSKQEQLDMLPRKIFAGDLFLFHMPQPVAVKWCAIFKHPNNSELWYVVPGDDLMLVGARDVAVPEDTQEGPMVLRCGCGLWVHEDDFALKNRIGQIDQEYVEQVRDHLSRIVDNDLSKDETIVSVDDDPDYLEWMEELSAAVHAFEEKLLDEESETSDDSNQLSGSVSIPANNFSQNWFAEAGLSPNLSLAADSGGLTSLPEMPSKSSLGTKVDYGGEGNLFAIKNAEGIYLFICNLQDEDLPPVRKNTANSNDEAWHTTPNGFSTSLFEWTGDNVVLFIAGISYSFSK